jgi:O-antigen/teichoic acid export membrane protein
MNLAPSEPLTPSSTEDRTTLKVFSLEITQDRLWFWGLRSGLSLLDQGLFSGSSFLLNIFLARWLSKEAYGAFAVCFAGMLFLTGFHNVLLIEPMTVIGPSCYPDRLTGYFGAQLRAHLLIIGPLSLLALAVGGLLMLSPARSALAPALVASGLGLPLTLLFYLVRRMCYVVQNPLAAVRASAVYGLTLVLGAFALQHAGRCTPGSALLLMAVAGLLPCTLILRSLRIFPGGLQLRSPLPIRRVLAENWEYGHWLVLTSSLSWMLMQAQTVLSAGMLTLPAAGALRAMQLPSLALYQLMAATMLLLLPSISYELGRGDLARLHHKVLLSTAALTALGLAFVAALYLFSAPLERILFGGKYAASAWLMPVLGLGPVFTGIAAGLSFTLRALRKAKYELLAYMASAVAALALALTLMPRWGLPGAAVSIVVGSASLALAVSACYLTWGRSHA